MAKRTKIITMADGRVFEITSREIPQGSVEDIARRCLEEAGGNKIRAIKEFRATIQEQQGFDPGLRESKDWIYKAAGLS